MSQRVGPKVNVEINYTCNGCQYHKVDTDEEAGDKRKYHACHHPSVVEVFGVPQWFGGANPKLSIHHTVKTPKYMCPYLQEKT